MESKPVNNYAVSILYVEDDQDTRETLLAMLLSRYPEHRFISSSSGRNGLELFKDLRPDIVITDLGMPEMDGISMASGIKTIAPDTIIIALTAHSETSNLIQAIEIGISNYVLKPVIYERICSVIEQAITSVRKEKQLRDQYEQINRLNTTLSTRTRELELLNTELEAFNYTVAHDLRSPMANISFFVQSLLEQASERLDDANNKCLQIIYTEALRMSSIIESLLNFSSYTRKNIVKQWIDLSCIAFKIKDHLQLREPHRQVSFTIGNEIKGFGDPILISVVLENLIGNAWKYTNKTDTACIEFGVITISDELIYYVRDNGVGFNQEDAKNIFLPFHRLQSENNFQGLGIGLATTERIIQRHGGKIWAESNNGQGAAFYFTL